MCFKVVILNTVIKDTCEKKTISVSFCVVVLRVALLLNWTFPRSTSRISLQIQCCSIRQFALEESLCSAVQDDVLSSCVCTSWVLLTCILHASMRSLYHVDMFRCWFQSVYTCINFFHALLSHWKVVDRTVMIVLVLKSFSTVQMRQKADVKARLHGSHFEGSSVAEWLERRIWNP